MNHYYTVLTILLIVLLVIKVVFLQISRKNNRANRQRWHKRCWKKAPLEYLKKFWRASQETKFKITDTKFYVSVVTLSTRDNAKLLKQLESSFKRTVN